jgi:hypothetical protein
VTLQFQDVFDAIRALTPPPDGPSAIGFDRCRRNGREPSRQPCEKRLLDRHLDHLSANLGQFA